MPKWRPIDLIRADKIIAIAGDTSEGEAACSATFLLSCGETVTPDVNFCRRHAPRVGGYFLLCKAGFTSYSPAAVFESEYANEETQ